MRGEKSKHPRHTAPKIQIFSPSTRIDKHTQEAERKSRPKMDSDDGPKITIRKISKDEVDFVMSDVDLA